MALLTRPREILVIAFGVVACILGWCARAHASELTVEEAKAAIESLLEKPSPLLSSRKAEVDEIAAACVDVEERWGVPCLLLISMMHHESRFDKTAISSEHAIGLMQVLGEAKSGCDLETIKGQIECGSQWLMNCYGRCHNDWYGALSAYASGKCYAPSEKTFWGIFERLKVWRRLQKKFQIGVSTEKPKPQDLYPPEKSESYWPQ